MRGQMASVKKLFSVPFGDAFLASKAIRQ